MHTDITGYCKRSCPPCWIAAGCSGKENEISFQYIV